MMDKLLLEYVGLPHVHVILVSAQGPNPSFFFSWGTFIRLGGLLGQGLGLRLGPGLDNCNCKST